MRIFSSEGYCLRLARWMSLTIFSDAVFWVSVSSSLLEDYDETETLRYPIPQICTIGADVRHYLYRAVDKQGKALDFMLSECMNAAAATLFFATALSPNWIPEKIVIDKSGANKADIRLQTGS